VCQEWLVPEQRNANSHHAIAHATRSTCARITCDLFLFRFLITARTSSQNRTNTQRKQMMYSKAFWCQASHASTLDLLHRPNLQQHSWSYCMRSAAAQSRKPQNIKMITRLWPLTAKWMEGEMASKPRCVCVTSDFTLCLCRFCESWRCTHSTMLVVSCGQDSQKSASLGCGWPPDLHPSQALVKAQITIRHPLSSASRCQNAAAWGGTRPNDTHAFLRAILLRSASPNSLKK
jgi:hypothetical protein